MTDAAHSVALWSYAEADPTILGLVVGALSIAAIVFVASRFFARNRRR